MTPKQIVACQTELIAARKVHHETELRKLRRLDALLSYVRSHDYGRDAQIIDGAVQWTDADGTHRFTDRTAFRAFAGY